MVETQADFQMRDQRFEDLEEVVSQNAVTMERGLQECREGLASLQIPGKGQRVKVRTKNVLEKLSKLSRISVPRRQNMRRSSIMERSRCVSCKMTWQVKSPPRDSGVKTEASPERGQRNDRDGRKRIMSRMRRRLRATWMSPRDGYCSRETKNDHLGC